MRARRLSPSADIAGANALRILILGGSSEATALVHALRDRADVAVTLSLAGRTAAPLAQPVATRVGGFGGIAGLAAYVAAGRVDLLVDATHPFAAQMSRHAADAARTVGCPLIVVGRLPWRAQPGDRWREVADMAEAVEALGAAPRRVFLTVGRLQLAAFAAAPQHTYLIRTIDPLGPDVDLPNATVIAARGPFEIGGEMRLLREHRIDVLVTKNSGGHAASAKLDAARTLDIPVILIRRPGAETGLGIDEALATIEAWCAAATPCPMSGGPSSALSP